jgi:hypothetical protein
MQYSVNNNQDLLRVAQMYDSKPSVTNSTQTAANTGIEYSLFMPVIKTIALYQNKLGPSKEFAINFIKTLRGKSSISYKQMKVLRDLQKKCDPEYLKVPSSWKKN